MRQVKLFCLGLLVLAATVSAATVDLVAVERLLTTSGLEGEIHGAVPESGLFVFTYRTPGNFFDFIEMSLIANDPAIEKQLRVLSRHDRVKIKGRFLSNPSPQKHVLATDLEVVKKFAPPMVIPDYTYSAKIPGELRNKTSARFLVHTVQAEGAILVVEYKDTVIPIFVRNRELTKGLYRSDIVQLKFSIQDFPNAPMHLRLTEELEQPIRIVESIKEKDGKPARIEGALVLFPKSPQIAFNVFALLETLPNGLTRQYTLVNLENSDVFAQIRAKLQAAWDRHAGPGDYVSGRNKLVSRKVRVSVTGTFSQVDANQANPQILLSSPDSIKIKQ